MEEFIPVATILLAIVAIFFIGVFIMLNWFKRMLNKEHEDRERDNKELKEQIMAAHKLFEEIKLKL